MVLVKLKINYHYQIEILFFLLRKFCLKIGYLYKKKYKTVVMKLMPKIFCFLLVFFISGNAFSQTLEGSIFDKNTKLPLQSATVYLDGTTISTLTDENGYFKLDSKGNTKSDLVISFVGYLTSRINNAFQYQKIKTFLEEDSIAIDEVFIGKGPFTQKQMLKVFRQYFLGTSQYASFCKIVNEDDIYLYFDTDTNSLTATSRTPLKVINNFLGYEVNFDLVDFEVKFNKRTLDSKNVTSSSFAGTTFFKDISNDDKIPQKRKNIYRGSATHFMRTIAYETWETEKFKLIVDKFKVDPKEYFKISDTLGLKKITLIKSPMIRVEKLKSDAKNQIQNSKKPEFIERKDYFTIMYDNHNQSVADFISKEYFVDENGNYSPFYGVVFGGFIGAQKMAEMLPTDFYQSIKKQP